MTCGKKIIPAFSFVFFITDICLTKIETVTRQMRNHKKHSRAGNGSNFSFNQIQNVIEKPILNMRLEFVDNITRFLKWATWNEKD